MVCVKILDEVSTVPLRLLSDTAAVYRNEVDIGIALKKLLPKYNLRREDIFITSKLGWYHRTCFMSFNVSF